MGCLTDTGCPLEEPCLIPFTVQLMVGQVRNSVGAGDSMVAGFIAGLSDGDYEYALKLGTACGGATAFSDDLAKKNKIYELLRQIL